MLRQKIRLVIDTGVFIPCGDKSKDKKSSKANGNEQDDAGSAQV